MPNKLIDIVGVSKSYGDNLVLDDLNLYIRENEFLTLLGPSGCGKTTLLRILGGFENPDSGKVIFDGKDITSLAPNKRQLNTVFQKYALFTHMTIAENIAFGLKIKGKSKSYIDDKIHYALKLVNLEGYQNRYPDSLSGGQQQRIAIARAIVNEPKVLLFDEPLAALDANLRKGMQAELKKIQKEVGITFIFVTHDQEEALSKSDTFVVMNDGIIQQIGTPMDIYNEPQNRFVANFIGESNIIEGVMPKDCLVVFDDVQWECVDKGFKEIVNIEVVLRPEDMQVVEPQDGKVSGKIVSKIFMGVHYEYLVETNIRKYKVHTTKNIEMGSVIGLTIDPFDIQVMHKMDN